MTVHLRTSERAVEPDRGIFVERALSSRLVRLENANEMAVDRLDPQFETSLRVLK